MPSPDSSPSARAVRPLFTRVCVLALAAAVSLAAAGCGAGGSESTSAGASTTTPATALKPASGPPITAKDLTAAVPSGFRDATASAKPNPATGLPPEVQLTGRTVGGLRPVIRMSQLSAHSTARLKDVADSTAAQARQAGDVIRTGPAESKIQGDDAFTFVGSFRDTVGHASRREYILLRHGVADYVVVFVAPANVYGKDRRSLQSFVDSIRFR